jgi:polyisoprenoid-binding protein YceI
VKRILVVVVIVIALGGFGFWYWFIRDTAPPPATLTTRNTVQPASGPDGSYKVQEGKSTFAGFRIKENFTVGSHTAVVRTPAVTGSLTLQGTTVNGVTITADLTQLQSEDTQPPGVPGLGGRLVSLQNEGLEIASFPDAKFVVSSITLPSAPKVGVVEKVDASGKLTLHGVTKDVTVPIEARWNGKFIDATGSLPIRLADYSITAPSRPFVTVSDTGTLEFELTFAK